MPINVPQYLGAFVLETSIFSIRDRPKTNFPFTAENETGVENGSLFSAVNVNENWLLFSAENETENEADEKYSQPTVEVNL